METTSPSAPRWPAPAEPLWHVYLLGRLELDSGTQRLTRLPSRAVGALIARLALWPERMHAREELVELLWPGVDLAVGRNRLRQALSTLKSLIEPPGRPPALLADRLGVRVVPGALTCDAREFEALVRSGGYMQASVLYRGELMPGFYDGWIDDERVRLAALRDRIGDATPPAERPLIEAAAAAASQALAAADLGRATLPSYLTRYFGAEPMAARLRGQVLAHRLVTLIGPGGCGKTRLAVELAQALRDTPDVVLAEAPHRAFDLVAFVPLAACTDRAAMLDTLLGVLRVRSGRADPLERLAQSLADRRVLLVLDNLEQLRPHAAEVVARMAALLPQLHLITTSRHVLGVDGEREFRVTPLEAPAADASLEDMAANPAVALFIDRARAVRADFHLGGRNAPVLAALAQTLGGLPLAIELAASRVRSFTPAEMLERLRPSAAGAVPGQTPGLDLLARSGPRAGLDPRHASMQRVVQWSWNQLPPAERGLLAALTVFEAGFTAAAAAAVSAFDGDTHAALDELHASSLLSTRELRDGTLRFSLYEPVREFALASLAADELRALRARHRAWWPQWAAGFGATPALAAVRAEIPNIVSAMASAVADGVGAEAVRIALAVRAALNDVALPAGGLTALEAGLQACDDAALKSQGHTLLGVLGFDAGQGEVARHHVEAGLALAPPDSAERARALHAAASVRWRVTRSVEGIEALLDEAMQLAQAHHALGVQASVLALRAYVANAHDNDHARGETLHRQALTVWEQLGNEHAINGGIYNLAVCAGNARRYTEALLRLEAVCATAREHEDWQQLSAALNLKGNVLAAMRDWPRALGAYRECVDVAWAAAEAVDLAFGLWNAPGTLARLRQPAAAARLMAFAEHHWTTHFGALGNADRHEMRRVRRLVDVQLGRARSAELFSEGARLSLADAVALVRSPPR